MYSYSIMATMIITVIIIIFADIKCHQFRVFSREYPRLPASYVQRVT